MQRPWQTIEIRDCGEPLVSLPSSLFRWNPHPYAVLGAPYPAGTSPFQLRQAVLLRLLKAQTLLPCRLLIFDAWRPIAVQKYMVEWSLAQPGSDPAAVDALWAPPSSDPLTPPPHSTGSAVDLCLAGPDAEPLEMGGPIDSTGAIAEPNHFCSAAAGTKEYQWHSNRQLLARAMARVGFCQHPHEWWHFSYGDQMWAWHCGKPRAIYAAAPCP